MDFMVTWLQTASPSSKLLLLGLLPDESQDVAPLNQLFQQVAQNHSIGFAACVQNLSECRCPLGWLPRSWQPPRTAALGFYAVVLPLLVPASRRAAICVHVLTH
jgi:hypothetical protein